MSKAAHQERLMTVIRGPHLSEKAHIAAENNQIVFKVRQDATKSEIRRPLNCCSRSMSTTSLSSTSRARQSGLE